MTPTQETIRNLLVTATLAPLVSSLLVVFFGKRLMGKGAGWFATAVMGGAFLCSLYAAWLWMRAIVPAHENFAPVIVWNIPWIPLPGSAAHWLYLGVLVDSLTIAMMVMVCGVAALVHLYSIGYMKGDNRYERFFAYLSLFSFSMLGIVISQSLIQIFIFWELVGLTSYLLIGFWFEKRGPQLACKKAFVMNRIGDMGFLIGLGLLFYHLGGRLLLPGAIASHDASGQPALTMFEALTRPVIEGGLGIDMAHPPLWLTLAGMGLFCGAIGKSAQFPLHTWLPDAMEGPTPVSSIVHSATMVAAGVYLTARIYAILTPSAHIFVALIGLITLVIAACMALVMTDIKRVLAYSTLSQLGYMVLGLGAGAWTFALFHLITHAFFKCCLFQCSGSVIQATHHKQDLRSYGGLWRKMPITMACYALCTLAIAGASIPFTEIGMSGFYSKHGIIAGAVNHGHALAGAGWPAGVVLYWAPALVAYMTVFYMARSFALTFLGKPRDQELYDHAHEAPWTMWVPQIVLASLALLAAVLPFKDLIAGAEPTAKGIQLAARLEESAGFKVTDTFMLRGGGWAIVLALGIAMYLPGMTIASRIAALPGVRLLYKLFKEKFYFDALYDSFVVTVGKFAAFVIGAIDKYLVDGLVNLAGIVAYWWAYISGAFDAAVVDGAVNGAAAVAQDAGQTLRGTQSGRIRVYVLLLFCSAALLTLVVIGVAMIAR